MDIQLLIDCRRLISKAGQPGFDFEEAARTVDRINAAIADSKVKQPDSQAKEAGFESYSGAGKSEPVARDREADRKRFPDTDFNRWLDDGISDCGHTVYNAIPDIYSAFEGWTSRGHYTAPASQPIGSPSAFQAALDDARRIAPTGQGGETAGYIQGWRDVLEFIARRYAEEASQPAQVADDDYESQPLSLGALAGVMCQAAGAFDMPLRFLDFLSEVAQEEPKTNGDALSLLPIDSPTQAREEDARDATRWRKASRSRNFGITNWGEFGQRTIYDDLADKTIDAAIKAEG